MIGLILVTHAGLASSLRAAAEMIVGPIEGCQIVEVTPAERADSIMAHVVSAVEVLRDNGVIIMTDLFGGTPSNMAMSFLKEGTVEVVTGANLPTRDFNFVGDTVAGFIAAMNSDQGLGEVVNFG